jgi:mono/diheme cytochrome c family protein
MRRPIVSFLPSRLVHPAGSAVARGVQLALVLALPVGSAWAQPAFYTARVAPIFEQHCVICHGPEKKKAGLRLDSFEALMRGAESGQVIKPGDLKESELYRRVSLPPTDEDVMPSDGKPTLSKDEIKIIELWIASGASATKSLAEFPTAPVAKAARVTVVALAPDWRPRADEIARVAKAAGVRLVPRSQISTDGLVLRTASAPSRCDDAALEKLAPLAPLIVDAELARTKVTDAGLKSLSACTNLRKLDLTRTAVTSEGLSALAGLKNLEQLNLTETAVDDAGVAKLKPLPALKKIWLFGTKTTEAAATAGSGQ